MKTQSENHELSKMITNTARPSSSGGMSTRSAAPPYTPLPSKSDWQPADTAKPAMAKLPRTTQTATPIATPAPAVAAAPAAPAAAPTNTTNQKKRGWMYNSACAVLFILATILAAAPFAVVQLAGYYKRNWPEALCEKHPNGHIFTSYEPLAMAALPILLTETFRILHGQYAPVSSKQSFFIIMRTAVTIGLCGLFNYFLIFKTPPHFQCSMPGDWYGSQPL